MVSLSLSYFWFLYAPLSGLRLVFTLLSFPCFFPDLLGKSVGTDQQRQKNTYPALMGLDKSRQFADTLIDRALQALSIFDNNADPLRAIARYIIERQR